MDEERFRKELEARKAAHNGDTLAAVNEMLGEVIEDLESIPDNWRELAEADEILGLEPTKFENGRPIEVEAKADAPRSDSLDTQE